MSVLRWAIVLCLAGLAVAGYAAPVGEMSILESAGSVQLLTYDGLGVTLGKSDGRAVELSIGGKSFKTDVPIIRFEEVIEDPQAQDLLKANGPEAWGMPVTAVAEAANGHPGQWMLVSGENDTRPRAHIEIGQTEAQPLVLSGTCQAKVQGDAFGWWNRNLALNANVLYADGSRMPEVSAYFGQYDHGPQFNKRIICPDRPIQSVDLDLSVPGGKCTAWYKDVTLTPARYRISTPASRLQRIGGIVQQEFSLDKADLRGLITYQPGPECIEVRCSFQSTKPVDRAVSAWLVIPFDAVGGKWHDDVRRSRIIEAGKMYRDEQWYGAGRDGYNSRYPFACVETAAGDGLAIGTAVGEPRVFQTEYDAARRELRIRFDIGLSPDAGSWANRGSFTAYLFTYKDGFRGAAEKYHGLFEWAFNNRVSKQGTWLAFMSPLAIGGGYEDFHFQFLESTSQMSWDERKGMYSFVYADPWIHQQEFPAHIPAEEVHGPVVPKSSIALAKRISALDNLDTLPLDMRRRYPAYLGSYIEDQWGEPQGYFFRGGRNENMMIMNPDERIPPPPGSDFSYAGWDRNIIRETMGVTRQWHLPGWTPTRVSDKPFLEVDTEQKASGHQSVVLRPVEGRSYWEQYLRGMSQIIRCDESAEQYTFSYKARAEDVPEKGTGLQWRITFWHEDGKNSSAVFPVSDLGKKWQARTHTAKPERAPKFVSVALDCPTWTPDSTTLWIDDVVLTAEESKNLLTNGGLEEAELLPCKLDGVYLDIIECYQCNLNYRRAHWAFTDAPLTFDTARKPAMHQIFSHAAAAQRMSEWLHPRDMFVFGNCTPVTPFAAPYMDILGNELFWKQGDKWNPWPDSEFNFARFMSRGKPYCVLQYSNLSVEEQTKYVKRCLFYGVLPSNQAAPSGGWYWADPIVVDRHRPVFAKYVPTIIKVAEAGWKPVTLAHTDDDAVWIERFGEGDTFYLTVFNSSAQRKSATITLDVTVRAIRAANILNGSKVAVPRFKLDLDAEDVAVIQVERKGGRP